VGGQRKSVVEALVSQLHTEVHENLGEREQFATDGWSEVGHLFSLRLLIAFSFSTASFDCLFSSRRVLSVGFVCGRVLHLRSAHECVNEFLM